MQFPSKLIENAVQEVSKLPGIGKKTALRLVLHLLKQPEGETDSLANALAELRSKISYCSRCHNVSDREVCDICSNPSRNQGLICVVEDLRDVMAIENTGLFNGVYHVLGGIVSPLDGIGPEDLTIVSLVKRVDELLSDGSEVELLLALPATMEGDTTAFYISKKIEGKDVVLTSIARGIPVGSELEYADEITLGRSILTRTSYKQSQ